MDNPFGGMLGQFGPDRFHKLTGICETHGERTITVPKRIEAWSCPVCLHEETDRKNREEWVANRMANLHKVARIPEKYRSKRFQARNEQQKEARGIAKSFFDSVLGGRGWRVLLLLGEPGTGKTLLASELGESFIERAGKVVRYVTAMGMISEIKAAYGRDDKTEDGEIQKFADYEVLILDEVDQMRGSENDMLLLTEVINRRYNADLPMVVISNKNREKLAQYFGERIDDRICESCYQVQFDWPSFRRQQ